MNCLSLLVPVVLAVVLAAAGSNPAPGEPHQGPAPAAVEVLALVSEVEGAPELRRSGETNSFLLRKLHDLRGGDRITGDGQVLSVCPDGEEHLLRAPSVVSEELCTTKHHAAAASPDEGRWVRLDGTLVRQRATRNGDVEEDDLGASAILLSPRCAHRPGKPASCASWPAPPSRIYWLGLEQADTYAFRWSGDARPLYVDAESACGQRFLDDLQLGVPVCVTAWPKSWTLRDELGELTLEARRGLYQTLPGRDQAVMRRVAGPGAETPQPRLTRALRLYRADLAQPALAALLELSQQDVAPWPETLRHIRADLWRAAGLEPLAARDSEASRNTSTNPETSGGAP